MTAARQDAPATVPPDYAHLLCAARRMFEPDELERLIPRARGGPRLAEVNGEGAGALDPIAATEAIAYDFLAKGGKYSRPFITLAAYEALKLAARGHNEGRQPTRRRGAPRGDLHRIVSQSVARSRRHSRQRRISLRATTLHIQHGVPTAINVGDYLIGLGYRLVSRDTNAIGAEQRPIFSISLPMPTPSSAKGRGPSWSGETAATSD